MLYILNTSLPLSAVYWSCIKPIALNMLSKFYEKTASSNIR